MMKKLILFASILLTLASCKKTVETFKLEGTWHVDSYYENGNDNTTAFKAVYNDYKIKYDASNNYIETYSLAGVKITNAGTWSLSSDGNYLELTNQADNSKRSLHIIEIKASSAKYTESGTKEYHILKD